MTSSTARRWASGAKTFPPEEARRRLDTLRTLTHQALSGESTEHPAFAGLQRVAQRYEIPERYPMELIDGFAMDVAGREYRSLEDTLEYCYHVAGVVGVMMAYVMGVKEPAVLSRAADLGIAFQLTNISRDVMDDAANGRVYLPIDWLAAAGVPVGEIERQDHRAAVYAIVERLLGVADRYYCSANEGIRALGFRAGWAVSTASGVYGDIGSVVREREAAAWDQRAFVSTPRKLKWVVSGAWRALTAVSFDRRREAPPRAPDLWMKPDLC